MTALLFTDSARSFDRLKATCNPVEATAREVFGVDFGLTGSEIAAGFPRLSRFQLQRGSRE